MFACYVSSKVVPDLLVFGFYICLSACMYVDFCSKTSVRIRGSGWSVGY